MKPLTPHEAALALPGGDMAAPGRGDASLEDEVRHRLGGRSIVLTGLMGAGKTTIGRRLAHRLAHLFRDSDHEIEAVSNMSIPDIFALYGEAQFRSVEQRVIARLLKEGPMVLAIGGGAYMDPGTRARIAESAVSIWLKGDLDTLMRRVRKRSNRPLLQNPDPEGTMRRLMELRHPVYALADVTVESREQPHDRVAQDVLVALRDWLAAEDAVPRTGEA